MLIENFAKLDIYRKKVTPRVDKKVIEDKGKELGIKIPDRMIEFYEYYGLDDVVLSSDYELSKIDQLWISDSAL